MGHEFPNMVGMKPGGLDEKIRPLLPGVLSRVRFTPLGKRRLKGLGEELELFEVQSEDAQGAERIRDPVCGMEMAPTEVGAKLLVRGQELAFCCERCLRVFLTVPERYGASGEV
jgi:YHS domain-containing protein